jgi:predicted transposase/invertase (TIGR01784 family)
MEIELADEAAIMFLNTLGTKGDVSPDIQSLFDYINSNTVTSNFTREVADTITEIKNDKKVRDSYMTYEMRMKDIREESLAEGEAKQKLRVAKLMLAKGCYSLQEIVELSGLSIDNIEKLKNDMHIEKQA